MGWSLTDLFHLWEIHGIHVVFVITWRKGSQNNLGYGLPRVIKIKTSKQNKYIVCTGIYVMFKTLSPMQFSLLSEVLHQLWIHNWIVHQPKLKFLNLQLQCDCLNYKGLFPCDMTNVVWFFYYTQTHGNN